MGQTCQYKIGSKAGIYNGWRMGDQVDIWWRTGTAYSGYYINTTARHVPDTDSGIRYHFGTVYNHNKQPIKKGWVQA